MTDFTLTNVVETPLVQNASSGGEAFETRAQIHTITDEPHTYNRDDYDHHATDRDRAWLAVIDSIWTGDDLTASDVAEKSNVSEQTARAVLRVAGQAGWIHRDSPQDQT